MLILYKNDRNAGFVLFTKTSNGPFALRILWIIEVIELIRKENQEFRETSNVSFCDSFVLMNHSWILLPMINTDFSVFRCIRQFPTFFPNKVVLDYFLRLHSLDSSFLQKILILFSKKFPLLFFVHHVSVKFIKAAA